MEKAEEKTRLRERLGWRRRRCVELITAAFASEEEDGPKDSATTTEVSEGDKEYNDRGDGGSTESQGIYDDDGDTSSYPHYLLVFLLHPSIVIYRIFITCCFVLIYPFVMFPYEAHLFTSNIPA